MRRIGRGLKMAGASWRIVGDDRSLLILPALAGLALSSAALLIFGPAIYLAAGSHSRGALIVAAVIGAYAMTFPSVFFRVAFVTVLAARLDGHHASIATGLRFAWVRVDQIAWWAFVSATVAILIRGIRQLPFFGGLAETIASSLLGAAWGAVTYFVVPIVAIEGDLPRKAIKRSATIFREVWGLEIGGVLSIAGALTLCVFLPVGIAFAFAIAAAHAVPAAFVLLVAIAAGFLIAGLVLSSTLQQVFNVVLYRYATGRGTPPGFADDELRAAVTAKRRGLFGRR